MKIVIQQWAEEQTLHAFRVVAESVHEVDSDGRSGRDVAVHVGWADTFADAAHKATAAVEAFGCGLRYDDKRVDEGKPRKGARGGQ